MEIQIKSVSVKYMENQILNKKAFLLEGIKVDIDNLPEVFIKVNLSYQMYLFYYIKIRDFWSEENQAFLSHWLDEFWIVHASDFQGIRNLNGLTPYHYRIAAQTDGQKFHQ